MEKYRKIYKGINFCFAYGKIVSDIKFEFFYNSRIHNSIVEFIVESNYKNSTRKLKNEFLILRAYDDNADYIYKRYKKGKFIKIIGNVTSKYIEITEII